MIFLMPSASVNVEQLQGLARAHRVRRLELFGSAARGEAEPRDYDFLVEFEAMAPLEHGRAYFALLDGLERALNAPVDLVELPAVRNPYFLQGIGPERVVIYAA